MVSFEITSKDSLGRTGKLEINKKTVKTPALMPVLNPRLWSPDLTDIDIVITNSYIIKNNKKFRDKSLEEGLHSLFDFEGVIITDSGAYQASVYGDLEVTNREIIEFQKDIGSDIVTPLDIPTQPDVSKEQAKKDLEETITRTKEAAEITDRINSPIQGGIYTDLREKSGKISSDLGSIHPIGGVVPLLEQYRFKDIVDIVISSKKGLSSNDPVHLFGAGHPMFFSLSVAMGCDLFDSAAYALYAEDGRYLTPRGTKKLEDMVELACGCMVCSENTVDDLDFELLCQHNLNISFAEISKVRQAIHEGSLLDLVETRARSHPKILDGFKKFLENSNMVEKYDPVSKSTFLYTGSPDRPEINRHQKRLDRFNIEKDTIIIDTDCNGDFCFKPPFGPFPKELIETYPLNAEIPEKLDYESIGIALKGLLKLIDLNPETKIIFRHPGWEHSILEDIEKIERVEVKNKEE